MQSYIVLQNNGGMPPLPPPSSEALWMTKKCNIKNDKLLKNAMAKFQQDLHLRRQNHMAHNISAVQDELQEFFLKKQSNYTRLQLS